MYSDMYTTLYYHTKYFHCPRSSLWSVCFSLPPQPLLFILVPDSWSVWVLATQDLNGNLCPKWCHLGSNCWTQIGAIAFNFQRFRGLWSITWIHVFIPGNFSVDPLVASQQISRLHVPTFFARTTVWDVVLRAPLISGCSQAPSHAAVPSIVSNKNFWLGILQ